MITIIGYILLTMEETCFTCTDLNFVQWSTLLANGWEEFK